MLNTFKNFASDESGAVTVDWVVLTAALVGLGLAVMGVVSSGVGNVANEMKTQLEVDHVAASQTNFNTGAGVTTTATTTP